MLQRSEIETFIDIHTMEMESWASGQRSWTNLGPHEPYTPDVIATMDAQEVVKHAAAIHAYASLLMLWPLTEQYEWKDGALVPVASKPPEREPQPEPMRRT